ncbi:MAG TPA: hypothetical protein VIM35_06445 [Gallionella sp.]
MNPDTVYAKTEKGKERFDARDIPINLRHALILVDGRSTLKDLLKKGEGLALLADSLEMLEEMGLMAPVGSIAAAPTSLPSAKPAIQSASGAAPVKRQLVALAKNILGDKAEKVIRKIEETLDSNAALMHTIDNCGKVIKLTIDEKKAEAFVLAARDIMAKNG